GAREAGRNESPSPSSFIADAGWRARSRASHSRVSLSSRSNSVSSWAMGFPCADRARRLCPSAAIHECEVRLYRTSDMLADPVHKGVFHATVGIDPQGETARG